MRALLFIVVVLCGSSIFAEDYVARRHRELDKAEALHSLKLREADLRSKGVLPPVSKPRVSGFYCRGRFFTSFEEFRVSPERRAMVEDRELEERVVRDLERLEYETAGQIMIQWNKMTPMGRMSWNEKLRRKEVVSRQMGWK